MSVGPHPFGDIRIGIWVMPSTSLADKLRHRLPQLSAFRVTDVFLPPEATTNEKRIVRDAGYFAALYEPPPKGRGAAEYAAAALADVNRLAMGALELNIEGVADNLLAEYVSATVAAIRKQKPKLRLRINVVPFKGAYLPVELFTSDQQLYAIAQCYLGNMDERVAEDEVARNVIDYGIPRGKVSVMYAAHCSPMLGKPRVPALPKIRYRGSIYTDDLLTDAGYIT